MTIDLHPANRADSLACICDLVTDWTDTPDTGRFVNESDLGLKMHGVMHSTHSTWALPEDEDQHRSI